MTLMFSPAKLTAEVKSIEMHHQGLETALPGHNVGFNIKNVAVKNLRRGDVAGNAQQDPPSDVNSFEAQVGSIWDEPDANVLLLPVLMVSPVFRWSSWTIQGRSKQATLPSSTATLPTWPVALLSWRRSSTGEQARSWRTSRRYWCLETLRRSSWFPSSPCVWRASSHTLP